MTNVFNSTDNQAFIDQSPETLKEGQEITATVRGANGNYTAKFTCHPKEEGVRIARQSRAANAYTGQSAEYEYYFIPFQSQPAL